MTKISADHMEFNKAFAPVSFLGLSAILAVVVSTKTPLTQGQWILMLLPILVAGVGMFITKQFVWQLMDEMYDCGDHLLAKRGSEQRVIPLAHILSVSKSKGRYIELLLTSTGTFGRQVTFAARRTSADRVIHPFGRSPIYKDLVDRVAAAKANRMAQFTN
ncbi:MAG TPA: hypothetical protein VK629_07610 [Steroidobacteraceae bacterium]|nr:hypothetical protein [Steroidobacteraceae bacterium]